MNFVLSNARVPFQAHPMGAQLQARQGYVDNTTNMLMLTGSYIQPSTALVISAAAAAAAPGAHYAAPYSFTNVRSAKDAMGEDEAHAPQAYYAVNTGTMASSRGPPIIVHQPTLPPHLPPAHHLRRYRAQQQDLRRLMMVENPESGSSAACRRVGKEDQPTARRRRRVRSSHGQGAKEDKKEVDSPPPEHDPSCLSAPQVVKGKLSHCQDFLHFGSCENGDHCAYAHGSIELIRSKMTQKLGKLERRKREEQQARERRNRKLAVFGGNHNKFAPHAASTQPRVLNCDDFNARFSEHEHEQEHSNSTQTTPHISNGKKNHEAPARRDNMFDDPEFFRPRKIPVRGSDDRSQSNGDDSTWKEAGTTSELGESISHLYVDPSFLTTWNEWDKKRSNPTTTTTTQEQRFFGDASERRDEGKEPGFFHASPESTAFLPKQEAGAPCESPPSASTYSLPPGLYEMLASTSTSPPPPPPPPLKSSGNHDEAAHDQTTGATSTRYVQREVSSMSIVQANETEEVKKRYTSNCNSLSSTIDVSASWSTDEVEEDFGEEEEGSNSSLALHEASTSSMMVNEDGESDRVGMCVSVCEVLMDASSEDSVTVGKKDAGAFKMPMGHKEHFFADSTMPECGGEGPRGYPNEYSLFEKPPWWF